MLVAKTCALSAYYTELSKDRTVIYNTTMPYTSHVYTQINTLNIYYILCIITVYTIHEFIKIHIYIQCK